MCVCTVSGIIKQVLRVQVSLKQEASLLAHFHDVSLSDDTLQKGGQAML